MQREHYPTEHQEHGKGYYSPRYAPRRTKLSLARQNHSRERGACGAEIKKFFASMQFDGDNPGGPRESKSQCDIRPHTDAGGSTVQRFTPFNCLLHHAPSSGTLLPTTEDCVLSSESVTYLLHVGDTARNNAMNKADDQRNDSAIAITIELRSCSGTATERSSHRAERHT